MNKLDKYIVDQMVSDLRTMNGYYIKLEMKSDLAAIFFITLGIFSFYLLGAIPSSNLSFWLYIIKLFLSLFSFFGGMSFILWAYRTIKSHDEGKYSFCWLLDRYIPLNKSERNQYFIEQQESLERNFLSRKPKDEIKEPVVVKSEVEEYILELSNNVPKLVNLLFPGGCKSIFKLLLELKKDYGEEFETLVLWSLVIPRQISLDGFRTILISNRLSLENYKLWLHQESLTVSILEKGFSHCFSNYSEDQVKRLFRVNFNPLDYLRIIKIIGEYSQGVPIFGTLDELLKFSVTNRNSLKDGMFSLDQIQKLPSLRYIEKKNLGPLTFKVLENFDDLTFWGNKLRHCIQSYHKKCLESKCFLVGVYKNGEVYANVEIINSRVCQVKGFANKDIDERDYVRDYINNFLNISPKDK